MSSVEAHVWMRMQNLRARKPATDETKKPSPGQGTTLAASPKRTKPVSENLTAKGIQTVHVARHRVVVEPALDHRAQPPPEFHDGCVPAMPELRFQRLEFR